MRAAARAAASGRATITSWREHTSGAPRRPDGRAGTDLAWLVVASSLLAALAMKLHLVKGLLDWSSAFTTFDLSGVMALLVLVPIAATIFAYRRYRDAMAVRAELARLSLQDPLTGLPNRTLLTEWLDESARTSARTNSHLGVLFVDLDRFKLVNDAYGHEVGDALMVAVAERLRSLVRPEDRIIRYGGDEFVVVLPGVANRPSIERVARRIVDALEAPFSIGTDTMRISSSIGVAVGRGNHARPEDLIREADAAMYEAKAGGSGRYLVFDPSQHGDALAPLAAEVRLRAALANEELRIHYQPVVEVATGRIAGAEALLRWQDPERGLVGPSEFVPLLEQTGLIVPVGTWVLQEVCRQARRWSDHDPDRAPLKVTVNVSARQLAQVDFREVVTRALATSGVDHSQVCLEITESALMFDVTGAWAVLRHAKNLGVQLALDDFGTGYSSLSYVRRFDLDMLKIDRSFVEGLGRSPSDTAIVEHVIGLAHALGMVTVAEGVERPQQLAELQRLGCDLAQGFLFSPSVTVDAIDAMLADTGRARRWAAKAAEAGGITLPRVPGALPPDLIGVRGPTVPAFDQPEPGSTRVPSMATTAPAAEPPADAPQLPRLREFQVPGKGAGSASGPAPL